MFGIGAGELILILMLALFVLGPERMPKMARDIGRTVGDLRRTSDELKKEFLNADALIDRAASLPRAGTSIDPTPVAVPPAEVIDVPVPQTLPGGAADPGLTQAAVVEPEPDPDETAFDRDARLAREKLDDPARADQAQAQGWKAPTDEAGTNTDRWG